MPSKIKFTFDPITFRHSMDGVPMVRQSHHYLSLMEKAALELEPYGAIRIFTECAEDNIRKVLDKGFETNAITDPAVRLAMAEEYYVAMGMGRIKLSGNASGGEAVVTSSHADNGWVSKLGAAKQPINHVTCGFVAAAFAAAFGKPARSYAVTEAASIAMGNSQGRFVVVGK